MLFVNLIKVGFYFPVLGKNKPFVDECWVNCFVAMRLLEHSGFQINEKLARNDFFHLMIFKSVLKLNKN